MTYYGYSRKKSIKQTLSEQFCGLEEELKKKFLNLNSNDLLYFFQDYRLKYGQASTDYARKTYPSWRLRRTQLSGQTLERIIEIMPKFLTKEQRIDYIIKLRDNHKPVKRGFAYCSVGNWKTKTLSEIKKFIKENQEFKFPKELKQKASWLSGNDSNLVNNILNNFDKKKSLIRLKYIENEFKIIEHLILNVHNLQKIEYCFRLPFGTVFVRIDLEKKDRNFIEKLFLTNEKILDERKKLMDREKNVIIKDQIDNLLDISLSSLSETEAIELRKQIINEKINLDVEEKKADQRYVNTVRDLNETVRHLNNIEKSNTGDFSINQNLKTSSGDMNLHIKKNDNASNVIIVVVVCVVIALIVMVSSK